MNIFHTVCSILVLFLLITLQGCGHSDSSSKNITADSIISKDKIAAIPVKTSILEVQDETFLIKEKDSPKIKASKVEKPKAKISANEYSEDVFFDDFEEREPINQSKKEVFNSGPTRPIERMKMPSPKYDPIFASNPYYIAEGFDFPVGKPDANGYFLALRFGQKLHLGEDWNGVGGGNTDLGDPVYATADGYITFAEHLCCGWGNTVRIIHKLEQHPYYQYVESVSSHLNDIVVQKETFVKRGDLIGHIGTADGKYSAHLHLEMRTFLDMNIGPGYSADQFGYISPTPFIRQNR